MWGTFCQTTYVLGYAAAAANSLQSCPTLCEPIDSSPSGSTIPGILQARTLQWVAMSFSRVYLSPNLFFHQFCFISWKKMGNGCWLGYQVLFSITWLNLDFRLLREKGWHCYQKETKEQLLRRETFTQQEEKIDKLCFVKSNNFYLSKDTVKRMER